MRGCYAKLALKVNESKTAVASVWGRKFLGYCFWAYKGEAKRVVAKPVQDKLRERLRQLTSRTRGRSLEQIAADLRGYVPGWKSYFRLAQTPETMRELDQWLRRRLRAVQLKQWRSGPTIFRELRRLGARSLRGRRSLSQKVAIQGSQTPRQYRENRACAILRGQISKGHFSNLLPRSLLVTDDAASIASNARRWWHNSALRLNRVLTIAYFDRLGVPRSS